MNTFWGVFRGQFSSRRKAENYYNFSTCFIKKGWKDLRKKLLFNVPHIKFYAIFFWNFRKYYSFCLTTILGLLYIPRVLPYVLNGTCHYFYCNNFFLLLSIQGALRAPLFSKILIFGALSPLPWKFKIRPQKGVKIVFSL